MPDINPSSDSISRAGIPENIVAAEKAAQDKRVNLANRLVSSEKVNVNDPKTDNNAAKLQKMWMPVAGELRNKFTIPVGENVHRFGDVWRNDVQNSEMPKGEDFEELHVGTPEEHAQFRLKPDEKERQEWEQALSGCGDSSDTSSVIEDTDVAEEVKVDESVEKAEKMKRQEEAHIKDTLKAENGFAEDMKHLVDQLEKFAQKLENKGKLEDAKEIRVIKGRYEAVQKFSEEFVSKLEAQNSKIGESYSEMSKYLMIFAPINNVSLEEQEYFVTKSAEDEDFSQFQKDFQEHENSRGLGLGSFTIKPTQRSTKYQLELRDLVSYTTNDNPDYKNRMNAKNEVGAAAIKLNEAAKEHDAQKARFKFDQAYNAYRGSKSRRSQSKADKALKIDTSKRKTQIETMKANYKNVRAENANNNRTLENLKGKIGKLNNENNNYITELGDIGKMISTDFGKDDNGVEKFVTGFCLSLDARAVTLIAKQLKDNPNNKDLQALAKAIIQARGNNSEKARILKSALSKK